METHIPRKFRKLRDLLIERIDLVDQGSNPDARVVFFKRHADDSDERFQRMADRFIKAIREQIQKSQKGEKMSIEAIVAKIEKQEISTKEQAWRAIGDLVERELEAQNQRLHGMSIDPSTRQKDPSRPVPIGLTREQMLAEILQTKEGKRLWQLFNDLPGDPIAKREEPETGVNLGAAWDVIAKKANDAVAADRVKTFEQGVELVVRENPRLYEAYVNE